MVKDCARKAPRKSPRKNTRHRVNTRHQNRSTGGGGSGANENWPDPDRDLDRRGLGDRDAAAVAAMEEECALLCRIMLAVSSSYNTTPFQMAVNSLRIGLTNDQAPLSLRFFIEFGQHEIWGSFFRPCDYVTARVSRREGAPCYKYSKDIIPTKQK